MGYFSIRGDKFWILDFKKITQGKLIKGVDLVQIVQNV